MFFMWYFAVVSADAENEGCVSYDFSFLAAEQYFLFP